MESLDALKSIIKNQPKDNTAVEVCFYGYGEDMTLDYVNCENQFYDPDESRWVDKSLVDNYFHTYRRLKDIKTIITLMELNEKMNETVSGYLHGEEWEHWSKFNADKFTINT